MAVTLTVAALAGALGEVDSDGMVQEPALTALTRRLAVVTAIVERYAPGAPEAVQNEAAVRYAGYVHGSAGTSYGAFLGAKIGDGFDVEFPQSHGPAFRSSGAAAILSPWKVRAAGVIGE